MYNEDRKLRYINESESRNLSIGPWFKTKFEQLEKFEKKNGVDAAEFNVSEIFEFYKSLCTTSYNTLLVTNSQLSYYTEWCIKNNYVQDNQNHYIEITNDMVHMCLNKGLADEKIVTREELLHLISDLNNPSDQFLILGLFEGLGGKDNTNFCRMMLSDINSDKVISLKDGREIKMSDKLYALAVESAETYDIYSNDTGEKINNMRYVDYDEEIIKIPNNASEESIDKPRRIYIRLLRARESIGCAAIDRYALIESGRIERIKQLMEENNISDPGVCIAMNRKELERVWGHIQSVPQYVNRYFS